MFKHNVNKFYIPNFLIQMMYFRRQSSTKRNDNKNYLYNYTCSSSHHIISNLKSIPHLFI